MGLEINRSKTKMMIVDRTGTLETGNAPHGLEVVHDFIYLGSCVSDCGRCDAEVRRRIAKSAMTKLEKIWKDRAITWTTKMRLVRSLVFSICLYGVETWTLRANERKRLDAFEMWCWRRMTRTPWTARRSNASILAELGVTDRLSTICLRRIVQFFSHIARRGGDNLERLVVTGSLEGRRGRGRSPTRWTDQIKETTGYPVVEALRTAACRERWRGVVGRIRSGTSSRGHDPQQ
jgi:hypothetical protein